MIRGKFLSSKKTLIRIQLSLLAICRSRNGESGNGMRRMMGTRGIRVKTRGIRVGTQGIKVGMWGIRVGMRGMVVGMLEMWGIRLILCENLRVYCFG